MGDEHKHTVCPLSNDDTLCAKVGPCGPRRFPREPSGAVGCVVGPVPYVRTEEAEAESWETAPKSVGRRSMARSGCQPSAGIPRPRRACACVCTYTLVFTALVGQRSQEGGGISPESFTENIQNVPCPRLCVAASSCGETHGLNSDRPGVLLLVKCWVSLAKGLTFSEPLFTLWTYSEDE